MSLEPTTAHSTAATLAPTAETHPARAGVVFGVAAYGLWGLFPVYFKAVKHVPAFEVLAHRVIWSVVFLAVLMLLRRNGRAAVAAAQSRRTLLTLCATTLLIACNWLIFIWAVANNQLLQVSLGYFINPLFSILLGYIFLRERLRPWQTLSVALATASVVYLTIANGQLPGIALILAGSFGLYGLLRKTAHVEALAGLTIETTLLSPFALAFLCYEMYRGQAVFAAGPLRDTFLLMAAGVITATPLLWFTEAARRLRLATLGFLQYLAPTGHFLLAVMAYGEPFTRASLIAFAIIWTALLIYSLDTALRPRAATAASLPE